MKTIILTDDQAQAAYEGTLTTLSIRLRKQPPEGHELTIGDAILEDRLAVLRAKGPNDGAKGDVVRVCWIPNPGDLLIVRESWCYDPIGGTWNPYPWRATTAADREHFPKRAANRLPASCAWLQLRIDKLTGLHRSDTGVWFAVYEVTASPIPRSAA